jgi:hypothetical protein
MNPLYSGTPPTASTPRSGYVHDPIATFTSSNPRPRAWKPVTSSSSFHVSELNSRKNKVMPIP